MNEAYIILGGNLGDISVNLTTARESIEEKAGVIKNKSGLYRTAAWGKTDEPSFLNQVIQIETPLSPNSLLDILLQIELKMGRVRTIKNASRIIDIDILFYNDEIINSSNLIVPHPEIVNRRFVLVPLNEIARTLIHPVLKIAVSELLKNCKDELPVDKL
ncbi:MAG: 2-amino-4-hydroxy-6-hydroxymethyldihydropteridine diphosphokinase [Ginsengibacter sp.]